VEYRVRWRPFFLTPAKTWDNFGPEALTKGVNKQDFYDWKFGKGKTAEFMPRLNKAFLDSGCGGEMTMAGRTGPTLDSHRLITWAAVHGKQDDVVEELFKNYFLEGKTICDVDVLVAAAEKVGLEGAREFLSNPNNYLQQVQEEMMYAKGVSGVPFFIIESDGGKPRRPITLSGAQPPDRFLMAFEEMTED